MADTNLERLSTLKTVQFELLTSRQIRSGFISFFQNRGHTFIPSAPVVPLGDPTLLFTNAGMNQFKDIFLGQKKSSFLRAVNSQKCIRVSGKHNDLEEVGLSNRHHTFFEMLGNWSFEDYYKKEAIRWAWELITQIWNIPKNRLYATVHLDDEEAEKCWKSETDIDPQRILRQGEKDNFWEMGEIGPCGPCSEIHYDLGPQGCDKNDLKHICEVNGVCGRYIELWNLVFIQYHRNQDGNLAELPAKHVDTGAGLERIASVLQGGNSNYDCDLFQPLIRVIEDLSGVEYGKVFIPHRVVADHLRALAFAIADGALPSNEGRGYVLRRLLRRAAKFGYELGFREPFLFKLVPHLVNLMGEIYPELMERHQHITLAIKNEEEGFSLTLERGLDNFHNVIEKLLKNGEKIIPGEEAFKLYDTYGFPLDMTELLAREKGFTVEVAGFENAMMEQRGRARAGGKFSLELERETPWVVLNDIAITPVENWQKFVGYDLEQCETEIVKYRQIGQDLEVVVKDTPFYAESGGQVGDSGEIKVQSSKLKVINSYFNEGRIRILKIQWEKGFEALIKAGGTVRLTVDIARRQAIKRNHTATHLLHYALREKLGEHVHQAGSLVHPDYLRFDYTHYQKLDSEVLLDIERKVNCLIMENAPVNAEITKLETARKKGAMALFGEKYGEQVRMVSVGNFSRELCGGTHVRMSGDIGYFRITSETGVSAGVRRIEAITGDNALEMILNERQTVEYFNEVLHSFGSDVREKLDKFVLEKKELEKELVGLRHSVGGLNIEQLLADAMVKDGKKIVAKKVEVLSLDGLKDLGDVLREKLKSGIGFLGADIEGKAALVCVVTDDLIALKIEAGRLVKNAVKVIGGGGGGRAHLATAGAKAVERLDEALREGMRLAEEALK